MPVTPVWICCSLMVVLAIAMQAGPVTAGATPILVVVLSLAAFEQKVLLGTTLLAAYSLGHVALLLAAGAASGLAAAHLGSRAAAWAKRVHETLGVILAWVGVAILVWLLRPALA